MSDFLSMLDGANSDPVELGFMQGFPPAADKVVNLQNSKQFPHIRWSFSNIRSLMPTKVVSCAEKNKYQFPVDIDEKIGDILFVPMGEAKPMTVEDAFVRKVYGDGMLILHNGKIVYERYFNKAFAAGGVHLLMSVTKSFTGTLAVQLIHDGVINETALVRDYLPELANSAWGDATVRQVLDMVVSLDYSEDYADPNSEITKYGKALFPGLQELEYQGPKTTYEFLATIRKGAHPHGTGFEYKTVNTDVMAWIISRTTGKGIDVLFSERFLQPLGANIDGYLQIDGSGVPFAGGGMSLNLRDMAMFGEMMRNNGYFNGRQIVSKEVVLDTRKGGDKEKFATGGYPNLKGWSYRNMWWVTNNGNGAYMARGIHGQAIYIDPAAEMVLVRFASNPVASNAENDHWSLPAYEAVADYLKQK